MQHWDGFYKGTFGQIYKFYSFIKYLYFILIPWHLQIQIEIIWDKCFPIANFALDCFIWLNYKNFVKSCPAFCKNANFTDKNSCYSSNKILIYSPTHMFWEVLLEFGDTLTPVGCCLLADQLNVQVRPLTWSIDVTWCCPPHNSGRHICHYVLWRNGVKSNHLVK